VQASAYVMATEILAAGSNLSERLDAAKTVLSGKAGTDRLSEGKEGSFPIPLLCGLHRVRTYPGGT
jgi:hypothetical protein